MLAVLHRLPGHPAAKSQIGELPMEPLRGPGRGDPQTPVPDAVARRRRGIDGVPDGPRETPDPPADQEPGVAGAVPGPTANDDPTAAAHPGLRQRHLLHTDHHTDWSADRMLLPVQQRSLDVDV